MCTTRILAKSPYGIVFECPSCDAVQLVFGTAKMAFKQTDFMIFIEEMNSKVQSKHLSTHPEVAKSILINHPDNAGFSFVLTYKELQEMTHLIFQAHLLQEAYKILKVI